MPREVELRKADYAKDSYAWEQMLERLGVNERDIPDCLRVRVDIDRVVVFKGEGINDIRNSGM